MVKILVKLNAMDKEYILTDLDKLKTVMKLSEEEYGILIKNNHISIKRIVKSSIGFMISDVIIVILKDGE